MHPGCLFLCRPRELIANKGATYGTTQMYYWVSTVYSRPSYVATRINNTATDCHHRYLALSMSALRQR